MKYKNCKDLTDVEKNEVRKLIDIGRDNESIALMFNITPQSVAAYKAWMTRSGQGG